LLLCLCLYYYYKLLINLSVFSFEWNSNKKKQTVVQLYWTGCLPLSIHKRYPTTAEHEVFDLLAFRASAGSTFLRRPGRRDSSAPTMSMPSFVRTLDQHRTTTNRTPARKSFTQPDPRSSPGYRKTPRFPVDD